MNENFKDYVPVEKGKKVQIKMPGGYSKLYEALKDSNIYIKEIDEENIDKIINEYKFIKENFSDLLPENQLVIAGENKDSAKAYILMQKVEHCPITRETYFNFASNLDNVLSRVIDFYIKNLKINPRQNIYYGEIIDIIPRNIIWGKTKDDKNPRIYLIDNYPSLKIKRNELLEIISMILESFGIKNPEKLLPKTTENIQKLHQLNN
ncbi:MAG: hypothetical protein ACP5QN_01460 [Minisyncoccia bacterium]